MQQPVQYEIEALDDEAIKSILSPFKGRHVRIAVQEVEKKAKPNQLDLYEKALEVRERFKNSKIDPNINLSDLANEVNL
ncbi:hypothetical protein [Salmonirosea aquatica]|uniref:Uncharacterized protein n=1 Tax=Salmonirosea aquatica TaxID=2654236 RepID=A0A7C9BHN4_9BACT|nr:hypothetical protein [Cytophagaceae bacterium SJW1-29]